MSENLSFEEEKKHLIETIDLAKKELEEEEQLFKKLEKNTTDEFILFDLQKKKITKINNLKKALKNPYFARINFKEKNQIKEREIYIGKTNIFDENYNVVVADWRAPISSVYYDGEIGKTSYECLDGTVDGELLLKRQYVIENAELIDFNDIDITTNDELLQACLKENSDTRLKNIVATIQKEQNKIIRSNMFKPLIVQGVAGSGKTTVAIHRIAYLIYTYEKQFKPEDFLIIAPNKFFLDYIKNSLPDLGVDYVRQETFEEFAFNIIKDKIKVEDFNYTLKKLVENEIPENEKELTINACKYKGSLEFKDLIDSVIEEINKGVLSNENFGICGIKMISNEKLLEVLLDNYQLFPLKTRLEKLELYIRNKVENKIDKIVDFITKVRTQKINLIDKSLSEEDQSKRRIEIFEEYEKEINSLLKDNGKKIIHDFIKKLKIPSAIDCYKIAINMIKCNEADYIKKEFNSNLKTKKIQYEDLTALLYISFELFGLNEKFELKHIVIDEAQDFSEFQFYTLNKILNNNKSLTILGDIAQGIYDYRGIDDWKKVNKDIFNNEANIEYLTQSYRTTANIIEEANKVIEPIKEKLGIALAEAVSKYGDDVLIYKCYSFDEKILRINEKINSDKEKGYSNIAIIGKDRKICKKIYEKIKDGYKDVSLITEKSTNYDGGITIVPSYFSKGLEFDSVIIADYESYSESVLDKKLLYVTITRAMHSLCIL